MKRTSKGLTVWTGALVLTFALLALLATGCDSEDATADTTTSTTVDSGYTPGSTVPETSPDTAGDEDALSLTEADNNKSFTVSVGQEIVVVLEGNPTTGYLWESAMNDEAAQLITLDGGEPVFVSDAVDENVVGAGGKYTFTFTALAVGQVELKLKYWRSFEAQAEPLKTFAASITIK